MAIDNWYGAERQQIKLVYANDEVNLGLYGNSDVYVDVPFEPEKKQNLFWSVMRFVVLSAYVVSADPSESDWDLYHSITAK